VLVVHETHRVAGRQAEAFSELLREGWTRAASDEVRLLWSLEQAHGTGPAYTFVSLAGVASVEHVATLDERMRRGDLSDWWTELDRLRHDATAKVLVPTAFSPMTDLDLTSVPMPGDEERGPDLPLFMEDTAWPHPGKLATYLERAGSLYLRTLERAAEHGMDILDLVAAFTPMLGAGPEREVVLWQRLKRPEYLLPLLRREVPPEHRGPGTWMHDALEVRDRWESRLLRVAPWSPLA
jgi:hypothetical protein